MKPERTIGLHSVCPSVSLSVSLSVCHTCFLDFSSLCFHISEWKLLAIFHMKSYRSSLTSVTVDLLFNELLPSVQNSFSGLFSSMLSHFWMKVGSKLPYEELQIKFDFRHGWPTFWWVIALCSKFVSGLFLDMLSYFWMKLFFLPLEDFQTSNNYIKTDLIDGVILAALY